MGIEHGGEKPKGEGTNTKGEVESPGITERLETLGRQGRSGKPTGLGTGGTQPDKETHPSALWSWSPALRAGWSFQSERKERGSQHSHTLSWDRSLQPPPAPQHPVGRVSPGILRLLAPSPIKRDNLLPADACFTHRALLPVWPRLQPLETKYEVFPSTKRVSEPPDPPCLPDYLMNTYLMETGPTG